MDIREAADRLNGGEYGNEGSKELFAEMKSAGLVAVFGASDDLMEFRGAIDDEVGVYGGGKAHLTRRGLLQNECEDDRCPYHAREKRQAVAITAKWNEGGFSWRYEIPAANAKFTINEDSEPYCEGLVFALADLE